MFRLDIITPVSAPNEIQHHGFAFSPIYHDVRRHYLPQMTVNSCRLAITRRSAPTATTASWRAVNRVYYHKFVDMTWRKL